MKTANRRRSGLTRFLAATLAPCALLAALTACQPPPDRGALVIVVGAHANMPAASLTPAALGVVTTAVHEQDDITIVDGSGTPQEDGTFHTKSDCDSDNACADVWQSNINKVIAAISLVKPSAPQADLLAAVAIAGRQLSGARGPKHLLIIDSGLQTVGALPVQSPGVLDGNASSVAAIAASLKRNGSLPDLLGVNVLLTGVGWTYAPQQAPPERIRKRLDDLWATVFRAASPASFVADATPLATNKPAADLPTVTAIDFNPPPPSCHGQLDLRADQVGFKPDLAEFVSDAKARAVLKPIAAKLKAPGASATLIGTLAVPEVDPDSPDRLSLQRALAVKRVLVELGVPAGRLAVDGVGTHFAGFVPDTDAKGQLVEALAIQDRLVIIKSKTFARVCAPV